MSNLEPAFLGQFSVVNAEGRPTLVHTSANAEALPASVFGERVWIGHHCTIGRAVSLGNHVIVGDYSIVEDGTSIGAKTLLTYRAQVCEAVQIGESCVIGGFVGERATVGDRCRIFGSVVHQHRDPTRGWDDASSMESGAVFDCDVFVGFGAQITSAAKIGASAYICAGAIVSRDVPERHIVWGVNKMCHHSEWAGELAKSPLFNRSR